MPKGAELTAEALLASARASLARLGARPGDRWLCDLPAHHISGLGVLVRSLVSGSTPAIVAARYSRRAAGTWAEALPRPAVSHADGTPPAGDSAAWQPSGGIRGPDDWDGCVYVSLVPTQLRRLLDAGAPLAGVRAILLGGAAIPPGMLDEVAAAGARAVTSYGMTETCGGCVYDGVPLDGVQVAAAADGRIRISGPVLFSRYRLAPGPTADALDDGWFITSDLGGIGADGRLTIRGRADDVINSGGEKIVCDEVERALRGCAAVRDVAVVGVPDPRWGERVTAIVIAADPASPPSLELLSEQVRASLPRYAAPRGMLLVTELPLLGSGKPDRQLLRQMARSPGVISA
jgi:O-succinylbenzoic acid--CoA ligase